MLLGLQVEEFLHGPSVNLKLTGFSGIAHARSTAAALCANSYSGTYSIHVTTSGTGKNSKVLISKTKDMYNRKVRSKEQYRQELQAVKAMLTQVAD